MRAVATGPVVGRRGVTFRLPDPERRLRRVWLLQELRRPRLGPPLRRLPAGEGWTLPWWPRGGVDRMEYLFRVEDAAGAVAMLPDPGNPLRAAGAFGAKSVVEFPGYRRPCWLGAATAGSLTTLALPARGFAGDPPAVVWAPPGVSERDRLPLVVVHDGPDYADYAELPRCLAWAVAAGRLPALRAALLPAPHRDERYSASPAYAAALAGELLPALRDALPMPPGGRGVVGVGASLGALALLHAQRTAGAGFGGLYLQSGSFFLDRDRRAEGGLARFERVRAFVDTALAGASGNGAAAAARPVPVTLTCGLVEENLAGNRALARALRDQGHPVTFATRPDAHNWVAWRDTFVPHLVPFLRALWGQGGTR